MRMNLRPAFWFQFKDLSVTSLGYLAVMLALMVIIPLLEVAFGGASHMSVSGYGLITSIFLFVVGIIAPRSYIRLDIQMGVSRLTSFVSQLLSLLAVSALLALVGELLVALAQLFFRDGERYFFADMYQMIYLEGGAMGFFGHLLSMCFNISMFLCAYIGGMFFTLLFWRLNKLWTVVAAIGMVALFNLFINLMVRSPSIPWLNTLLRSFADAVSRGPGALMIFFLAAAAAFGLIEWLILRGAFIRPSK